MDPSKLQSDTGNDVNSLEGAETIVEGKENPGSPTSDTLNDAAKGMPAPSSKPPLYKRIWQKFNIYLLLFVLVILVAIAITVVFFVKNRNDDTSKDVINTQNLSEESLKQLSNSNVTVGSSKQILNVESNSIFAGAVLVRSNLEVAGTIKVGGDLQLPGITVSGNSRFSQLQADNVAIGASATVQGLLTVRNGMT
ncbi:MAG: hypothetical protein AAB834_01515, partial [Patescibacteria group bacterium]